MHAHLLKNLALLVVSTLLGFAVLELGLGLLLSESRTTGEHVVRDHSDAHVPKHREGAYTHSTLGVTASFNSRGFRVNPLNCNEDVAESVLIVGNSNIAAFFLNDGAELSAQLAARMNQDGCARVESFGVTGFGPDQSLFAARRIVETTNYGHVVFSVFADNDAGDLLRNNNAIVDGLIESRGYCFIARGIADRSIVLKAMRRAVLLLRGHDGPATLRHSSGKDDLCQAVVHMPSENIREGLLARARADHAIYEAGHIQVYMDDRYDIEFACSDGTSNLRRFRERFDAVVNGIVQLADEFGFEPVVLIHPAEWDVTRNHPKETEAVASSCGTSAADRLVRPYLETIGNRLPVIDLTDDFLGCNDCYFSEAELGSDNHWNARGVQIAADRLYSHLTRDR